MPACIAGSLNEDLLRRIEYPLEVNRVLRSQIHQRLLLTDQEHRTLAGRAVALGKLMAAGTAVVRLPPQSPNPNAFAKRFVKSIKTECLEQFVPFGENSLRHLLREWLAHTAPNGTTRALRM